MSASIKEKKDRFVPICGSICGAIEQCLHLADRRFE
jgi:hypothetical protein